MDAGGVHRCLALVLVLAAAAGGCIAAPDVVLLDQRTALEMQAAGEYRALENDLLQAGISPKPEDITRKQLEAGHADLAESSLGEVVRIYSAVQTDAAWIDEMLVAGCIGEGLDGLLVQTPEECTQEVETGEIARIVGRANLHRRQIWQLVGKQRPRATEEQIRSVWREVHLKRVVCQGRVEVAEGVWEKKKC
jgi:hypothetical protein